VGAISVLEMTVSGCRILMTSILVGFQYVKLPLLCVDSLVNLATGGGAVGSSNTIGRRA
jgi:hypothetical protein